MRPGYRYCFTDGGSKAHVARGPNATALCGAWVTHKAGLRVGAVCKRCALYLERIEADSEGSAA
jgi:hypothetical protein